MSIVQKEELDFKNITHFNGLNALRFIAALLVVLHHGETIRKKNELANIQWLGLFQNGGNAVTFFFVLSGFLITYLLLRENKKKGGISVRNFYLKRVLRIWPLYFLLVIMGTLILPLALKYIGATYEMPYTLSQTWYYFVFFVPGLVTFYFGTGLLDPLWSIGVEEVFYLIWAPLFQWFRRNILTLLLSVIFVKMLFLCLALYVFDHKLFTYLVQTWQFEAMAIGGIGAYLVFNFGHRIANLFIYKLVPQILIYVLLIVYIIFHANFDFPFWKFIFQTPLFSPLLLDGLFLYTIIGIALVPHNLFQLNFKFLDFLGEISYGIYMYHMLVIFAIMQFGKKYFLGMNATFGSILFYSLLIILVVITAAISKKTFEDYFLKLKHKLL
jgi:peptidoglycan/LPS O-acetylase OafA/YrhL